MPAALQSHPYGLRDGPVGQRTVTLALVVAVHLLLLFLLLRLSPPFLPTDARRAALITFDVAPGATVASERTRSEEAAKRAGSSTPTEAPITPKLDPRAPPPLPVDGPSIWSQVVPLTRQEMAAGDIANFPSRPAPRPGEGEGESGSAGGQESADTSGPGKGPNGEPLYNVEWYRRPTSAELSAYLPAGAPREGWGMIGCRMVENYRVEDCFEIAQSPAGSGLSGAVRQAAWQFRVLPPRIGRRKLVGAWVRIRIDYSIGETG